jgi:hypothetical protein
MQEFTLNEITGDFFSGDFVGGDCQNRSIAQIAVLVQAID